MCVDIIVPFVDLDAADQADRVRSIELVLVIFRFLEQHAVDPRTIPQGMTAMLAYDPEADDDTNIREMTEAAGRVSTGQVTFAARNSEFGGFKIREGEILALDNGKLEFTEKDPVKAAYKLTKSMVKRDSSFVTLIYGADVTEEQAQELTQQLETKLGDHVEITTINGGQPVYYFILSVE